MGFTSISPPSVVRQSSATLTNRIFTSAGGSGLELSRSSDAFDSPRFRLGEGFFELGGGGASPPDTIVGRFAPLGLATTGYLVQDGRIFDRLGWTNVMDFGAVGDGATDDGAAINSAFALAGFAPLVVYFPPGIYLSTIGLRPRSNTMMLGCGTGVTVLKADASMGDVTFVQNDNGGAGETGNDNIVVADLSIDCNGDNRSSQVAGHGFNFGATDGSTCDNITIRNVEQYNAKNAGTVMVNCVNLTIQDCHVHDNQRDGIAVYYNSRNVTIANNYVHDVGDDMIAINGELTTSTGHSFRDFTITGNTCGPSITISANQGIVVRGAQRGAITGNSVLNGDAAGIYITSQNATTTTNVAITGNVITGSGAAGGTGYGLMIGTDTFVGGTPGQCTYVTIANNVFENNKSHGIFLWAPDANSNVSAITIVGNVLRGRGTSGGSATADGIQLAPSSSTTVERVTIQGNTIGNWARYGVSITPNGTIRNITFSGNQVTSNGKQTTASGVHITGGASYTIVGNGMSDTATALQTYGLEITGLTGSSVVTNNLVTGNLTGGVNASGNSANTLVANNQV